MTGTPAERAAQLSARIHREINAGRPVSPIVIGSGFTDGEASSVAVALHGIELATPELQALHMAENPFFRLGAELRAIALGNAARKDGAA